MRLWTVHPCYLDAKGLVAAWREALLAQKVLRGATRGYRYHPQLARFRSHPEPLAAIGRDRPRGEETRLLLQHEQDRAAAVRQQACGDARPTAVRMAPPEIEAAPARARAVPQLSGPRAAAPAPSVPHRPRQRQGLGTEGALAAITQSRILS